ncbi:uncharacterized protein TNCV_2994111 [Trichonephila clavipes]|nr:uncharacterized protein TNCV_2994111 [Trichonephila clavipes]
MTTSEQKAFCLQTQNLCHERSGGHVNTHNAHIWSLENSHEVLESYRDSPQLNISRRKVHAPFVFGEPTVTGSAYLDARQLWLFSQMKESEPNNFI